MASVIELADELDMLGLGGEDDVAALLRQHHQQRQRKPVLRQTLFTRNTPRQIRRCTRRKKTENFAAERVRLDDEAGLLGNIVLHYEWAVSHLQNVQQVS